MFAAQLSELLEDRALCFGAKLREPDMKASTLDEGEAQERVWQDSDRVDRSGADHEKLRYGASLGFVGASGRMAIGGFGEAVCSVRLVLERSHVYRKCIVEKL